MKIAIVENERREIEGAFDYANFKFFHNSLHFEYYEGSQQFLKSDVDSHRLIVVDIELSRKSVLDGYGLIKLLIEKSPKNKDKIVVITGHHKVEEKMREFGIPQLPVIYKPTDFNQINETFRSRGIGVT